MARILINGLLLREQHSGVQYSIENLVQGLLQEDLRDYEIEILVSHFYQSPFPESNHLKIRRLNSNFDSRLEYTIFRFFNTYGPKQSNDFVIPRFVDAAVYNKDITIYGDGSQTRTFCHVNDNVENIIKIITESRCVNDVINIGCSTEVSIKRLAEIIISITKSSSSIVHLSALKEGDMSRRQPDEWA